jgi:group I intron endonuclease
MVGGIYQIRNTINGKVYIGSAVDFSKRRRLHWRDLRIGKHRNPKLSHAWRKYGEEAFIFEIVESIEEKSLLLTREQFWLDKLGAVETGYNCYPTAGSPFGTKHSEERKRKTSERFKAMRRTAEWRSNIAAGNRGKKRTEAQRAKLAEISRNRSPEIIAKIHASRAGYRPTEETKAKVSAKLMGRIVSAETRAKLSATSKGRTHSEETKAKRLASWKATMAAKAALR